MGRRSINTTKSGKYMNPTDQFRKEARKRELKKNKKQRIMVRTAVLKGKDPMKLLEEMEVIDRMEYNPLQPPSLNEKVLREKRKKLRETYDRVFKLYEKERPEYAVELRKANAEYEKTRNQLQLHYDQVRNAERVQLDQIPLPEAPVDTMMPGTIPLPTDFPAHMLPGMPMVPHHHMIQPHSILKKTSAYGGPPGIGPQVPAHLMKNKKRKPPGPPPGPPPALSDTDDEVEVPAEDELYVGRRDPEVEPEDVNMAEYADDRHDRSRSRDEFGRSRRIRFADDDNDEGSQDSDRDDRYERRRERREKKKKRRERERERPAGTKKKVSALQAMMLKMAGQEVPEDDDDEEEQRSQSSTSSSSSSSGDEGERRRDRLMNRREEDRRIHNKDQEIARRRQEISQLDDRPPGLEDPVDRLTEEDAAALAAARLIEEAEAEAETRHVDDDGDSGRGMAAPPRMVPPGPPPGLPPALAGVGGIPGPPPGAPPVYMRPPLLRGGPVRLMPPGPPPGRPQGMPPGPPPGLPGNIRPPRIPLPVGIPPPRMMRPPVMPPNVPPPQLPPSMVSSRDGSTLSAPPSIMRPREDGGGSEGPGGSRVTIQAKPQIKSKMGDVTRFMPTALKVKREMRDQKGRIRQTGKEEEPKMIGAQAMPQPAPATQTRTKDDAYDQFMKEMEGLI